MPEAGEETDPVTDFFGDDSVDGAAFGEGEEINASDFKGNWRKRSGEGISTQLISAAYLDFLSLEFSISQAKDLVAGFFYQGMNDIFLYNAEDCTFWAFDALSDLFNGILLFIEDDQPGLGIMSFSFALEFTIWSGLRKCRAYDVTQR